jgi:DNA sulfur modification protein DndD
MRINSITVSNFGIFLGTVHIELSPVTNRNIILIGGKNGSGKTTLLEAIRLALYGTLAFGLRHPNANYLNYIRERLNIQALAEGAQEYSVGVELEIKASGNLDKVNIIRCWNPNIPNLKETVEIIRNDTPLTPREASDFISYMFKIFPPSLLDFFYFDGERLHEYFRGSKFEDDLRASALTLFNLDLFAILSDDLNKYLEQNNVFRRLPEEQRQVSKLETQQQALQGKLQTLGKRLQHLEQEIMNRTLAIRELERDFRIHGGLLAEERVQLQTEINNLEEKKRALHEWIKEVVADILPFFLVIDLFLDVKGQIYLEEQQSVRQIFTRWLGESHLREILAKCFSSHEIRMEESILSDMVAEIQDTVLSPFTTEDYRPLHLFSAEEKSLVFEVANAVENLIPQKLTKAFGEIATIIKEIQARRRALEESTNNDSLDIIIQQIKKLYEANERGKVRMAELSITQEEYEHELKDIEIQINDAHKRLAISLLDKNVYRLSNGVGSVVSRFVELQTQRKTTQLSSFFTEIISVLMRKEGFINKLTIEPGFSHVTLQGHAGVIPRNHLSAGEKQLYVLALVWALIKTSQKEIPLLFDTLIGRLDNEHRSAVIDYFLPNTGVQTIVFATDTEINWIDYQRLKPYIAREYLIEFNQESHQVEVYHGYFFDLKLKGGGGHGIPKEDTVEML